MNNIKVGQRYRFDMNGNSFIGEIESFRNKQNVSIRVVTTDNGIHEIGRLYPCENLELRYWTLLVGQDKSIC